MASLVVHATSHGAEGSARVGSGRTWRLRLEACLCTFFLFDAEVADNHLRLAGHREVCGLALESPYVVLWPLLDLFPTADFHA